MKVLAGEHIGYEAIEESVGLYNLEIEIGR